MKRVRRGFTLVELLVVIAIIGILVAMTVPALNMAREASKRNQCRANLRQFGIAIQNYGTTNLDKLPAGSPGPDQHGLFTTLLQHLDERKLYDEINIAGKPSESQARFRLIKAYVCPSYPYDKVIDNESQIRTVSTGRRASSSNNVNRAEQLGALSTYQAVGGVWYDNEDQKVTESDEYGDVPTNGLFGFGKERRGSEVKDGFSKTLAMGEFVHHDVSGPYSGSPGNIYPWILGANEEMASFVVKVAQYTPNSLVNRQDDSSSRNVPYNHLPMGSYHSGGTLFLVGDGSVRLIGNDVDLIVYQSISTCRGGELVEEMP